MKLLSIPGLTGIGVAVFGAAFLIDGMAGGASSSVTGDVLLREVQGLPTAAGELVADAGEFTGVQAAAPEREDLSGFLHIPLHKVRLGDGVSREVIRTSTVTKIGYGRVTQVNVATTATGTYSTDALQSGNIQYPGITVDPAATHSFAEGVSMLVWERGFGWVPYGGELVTYSETPHGGRVRVTPSRTCISERSFRYCR